MRLRELFCFQVVAFLSPLPTDQLTIHAWTIELPEGQGLNLHSEDPLRTSKLLPDSSNECSKGIAGNTSDIDRVSSRSFLRCPCSQHCSWDSDRLSASLPLFAWSLAILQPCRSRRFPLTLESCCILRSKELNFLKLASCFPSVFLSTERIEAYKSI